MSEFNWKLITGGCLSILVSNAIIPPEIKANAAIIADNLTGKTSENAVKLSSDDKVEQALKFIFKQEGKCQNWPSDSGNYFQGKLGYTCEGIIPETLWNAKEYFKYCLDSFSGHPADSVKFCYDKDPKKFHEAAKQTYINKYFAPGGCAELSDTLAFISCADVSILSGVGKSKKFVQQTTNISSGKERAKAINELHRQQLMSITNKPQFHEGWGNRKKAMDEFINSN